MNRSRSRKVKRSRSQKTKKIKKKVFLILGTSSTGKTSLIQNYLLPNTPHSVYVWADGIFDDLTKEFAHVRGLQWKELKPMVRPRMIEEVKKIQNKIVFVDDITPDLLDIDVPNKHSILLYTPLHQLARQAKSRKAGDSRPLAGVLNSFIDFYTTDPTEESIEIDIISKDDIADFLDQEKMTEKIKEKAFKKACRKMKLKGDDDVPLYTRRHFDTVVNTEGLSTEEVYHKIKRLFK